MRRVSIWTYIGRGVFYAITSGLALLAGYLIQPEHKWKDLLVLCIPMGPAIFFFICYANKYHDTDSEAAPSDEIRTALQTQAPFVFLVIAFLFIVSLIARSLPPYPLLIAFAFYALLYIGYGIYLLRNVEKRDLPLVRHQLVWPAILSIAISFYYGINYESLSTSTLLGFFLLPIGVLLILFFLSEVLKWPRRVFVRNSLLVFFIISLITVLAMTRHSEVGRQAFDDFSSMLFSLSIAAYLAVFESWRVTAEIARRPPGSIHAPDGNLVDSAVKAMQFVTSSLAFLAGSIWVLPIYFVYSQASIPFLLFFAGHAAVAFLFWFYAGTTRFLLRFQWVGIKLFAGFSFLTLIVVAIPQNNPPTHHFVKNLLSVSIISLLFIPAGFPIGRLLVAFKRLFKINWRSAFFRLFDDRINTVRLLCLACWLTCVVIVLSEQFREEPTEVGYRAEYAFSVYGVFILICAVLEGLESLGIHKSMVIALRVLGFLQTIRVLTSAGIAAAIVLPCIFAGMPTVEAIALSLPFCFAAMGGFALNDYFDVRKDRINKPHRAIPSGRLTRTAAIAIAIFFIGGATLMASLVQTSNLTLLLYLSAISGVLIYNLLVKYFALSKTLFTAGISSLPVVFDVKALEYSDIYLLVPLSTMLFLLGRELLMDVTDVEGDRHSGVTTIPMLLGKRITVALGFFFQILGAALLFPLVWYVPLFLNGICLAGIVCSIVLATILWRYQSGKYQRPVIIGLWIPLGLGIVMLLG